MAIVSSTFKTWPAWSGFVHVEEQHTDSIGGVHFLSYDSPIAADRNAALTANAALIADQLASDEFEALIANG